MMERKNTTRRLALAFILTFTIAGLSACDDSSTDPPADWYAGSWVAPFGEKDTIYLYMFVSENNDRPSKLALSGSKNIGDIHSDPIEGAIGYTNINGNNVSFGFGAHPYSVDFNGTHDHKTITGQCRIDSASIAWVEQVTFTKK